MNRPTVTENVESAVCPYAGCGREIGSPLALAEDGGPNDDYGPWIIECPACGRHFRLKRHRELVTIYQAQELEEHLQGDSDD